MLICGSVESKLVILALCSYSLEMITVANHHRNSAISSKISLEFHTKAICPPSNCQFRCLKQEYWQVLSDYAS